MCAGNKTFYDQLQKYGEIENFDRNSFKFDVRNSRFPNRDAYPEHIPLKVRNVISKCLRIDPNERYQSSVEIVNDLSQIDESLLDWEYTQSPTERKWRKSSDSKEYQLLIDQAGVSTAQKSVSGKKPRRIQEFCSKGLNKSDIKRFLKIS